MGFAIKWVEYESAACEAKPLLGHCIQPFQYERTVQAGKYECLLARWRVLSYCTNTHIYRYILTPARTFNDVYVHRHSVVSIASFFDRTIINNNPQRLPDSFIRLGTTFDSSEFDMAHTLFRAHLLAGANIYTHDFISIFSPFRSLAQRSSLCVFVVVVLLFFVFVFCLLLPSVGGFFCARFYFYTHFFFCLEAAVYIRLSMCLQMWCKVVDIHFFFTNAFANEHICLLMRINKIK